MKKLLALAAVLMLFLVPVAANGWAQVDQVGGMSGVTAPAWGVDAAHTEINFSVTHFFTPVTGSFKDFEIELAYDAEHPEQSTVAARIAVASLDTGNAQRDEHLLSADFFEAATYPYITFESTSVEQATANELIARGILTIKGQKRAVELPIKLLGTQQIPAEKQAMLGGAEAIASFQAATTIDRRDFGVGVGSWAATLVVGRDVGIDILVEAHRR